MPVLSDQSYTWNQSHTRNQSLKSATTTTLCLLTYPSPANMEIHFYVACAPTPLTRPMLLQKAFLSGLWNPTVSHCPCSYLKYGSLATFHISWKSAMVFLIFTDSSFSSYLSLALLVFLFYSKYLEWLLVIKP